jgi:hypothetical protein
MTMFIFVGFEHSGHFYLQSEQFVLVVVTVVALLFGEEERMFVNNSLR